MYINNYNTYENFGLAIKHKNNEEIIIDEFITKLTEYITNIKKLNTTFYDILDIFKNVSITI